MVKNYTMAENKMSIPAQIKIALDGRTRRWLSFEVRIPEHDLSRKMNEVAGWSFSDDEIARIEERLKFKIEREEAIK